MAGKLKDLYVKRNQNQYQPAADSWEARAAELSNMSGGAMPQGETAGNGAFGWLKDSADAGFFNTLGGTARLAGEFMPFGNDTFNSWADKADEIARRNSPQPGQNLEGIDYVASAVGNALGSGGASALEAGVVAGIGSLLGVGGVAGAALGGASKVIPGVGKAVQAGKTLWGSPMGKYLVANVAGSPFEAASESGNLISDMRKENQQGTANYSDEEIRNAAIRSGALNLAWLTGMNMLEAGTLGKITGALGGNMAAKGVKDIAKRATLGGLSSGIGEGAEEYGQNLIGDYSKRGNTADFNYDEALEAAKLGAIGGGVLGGVGSGLSATFSKNNSDVSEEIASEDGGTIEEAPEANVSGREAFINAIAGQESEGAGGYEAENGDTKAYGKYQILPSNWPKWAAEAGLSADAPQTPENQEIVARFKLGQYYDKYGARGAAIAWYGGEGALNYSDEALNRKQGDNGEYPSINEYADEVLGRMGNVADSVRIDDTIDDTEENYFDNYTDDTIPDSLNPVRGFDVSHLDKGTAQDRNSLLYGERVKKAKPAPASEEVASFNQSLDNSNAQKAPNSLFANSPRSWDAAERIYKARAKEQAERKARAQAIVNIANAQQQSFLNVLRNRAAQQWDNAEQEYKDRKQDKLQSLANVINARAIQKWDAKEADNAQKARVEQEKQAQLQNIARLLDARAAQQWDSAERDANLKQNQAQALANLLNAKAAGQYDVAQQVYANRAKEQAEKQRQQQAITNIINARAAQKFDEAETADKFKFVPQRQSMYDGAMRRNLAAQDKVKPEEQPSVEPTERNGAALDKRNMLDVTLPKVREQHKWDKEHKEYHAERYGESALPQTQLLSTDRAARRNMPKPGIEARSFINDRAEKKSARERMQDAIAFVWKDDPKHPLKACRRQLNMFRDMRKEYLQPIYDVMAEGAGNGVSRIPIIEFDNQHRGRFYRQSNNSPWYAKYFKEHKKKPTKKAMYDIAEEVAFGENADVGYYAGVQGKELEAIVAENHAQLDPINDYIQTYESLELRLKENPNYGKEQAERINKAEEARRAEKRNAGETASAESIQTEAKQPAESNQDEVKETAEPQEKPEPRDLFFTVKSNGKEEDNVIIVDIMPVKEPKYQQTIKKLIDAGWKKAETNTIPNVALDQYYAPATEENYNLAKGLTNKAVGYNLMGGQPGGWDYMQKLLDHEAEERRKSERTLGEILEDEGITADITVDDNQSITIEFSKKPSDEVRQSVKEAGYKWRAGEWKSKVNERSMEIAKELGYKPAEKAETEQSEKLNLPKGTTVDVSIVGDNSNIIQVKFNGAQGKGTGGIMGRAGYKWKSDKQVWQARKTEKAMDVAEQLGYKPTEEMSEDKSQQIDKYKNYSKEDIKINKERLATMPDVDGILQPAAKKFAELFKAHFPKSDYTYETVDFWNNYILEFEQLNKILKKYRQATQQGDLSAADAYFQQISSSLDRLNNLLGKLVGKDKEEQQAQMRQEFRDSIIPFFDEYNKIVDKHNAKEDAKKASKAKKQQNQGKQEYKYYLNARPADVGAVPKGFIRVDTEDKGGRYGAIYYDRQLSDKEVQQYELKSDADAAKEKAQTEAVKQVSRELMKSEKVAAQAKNNSLEDFTLAYYDDIENYLADHIEENPVYADLLNDPVIIDKAIESESIIKNTYEKLREKSTSEETSDKPNENNKSTEKQETKEPAKRFDKERANKTLASIFGQKNKAREPKPNDVGKKFVNVFDESKADELIERIKNKLNRLNANPIFDPELMSDIFHLGGIYLQQGVNKFAHWSKLMVGALGESVRPFLTSAWNSVNKFPAEQEFNADAMQAVMERVGNDFDEGKSLQQIKKDLIEEFGDEVADYVDAAYEGVKAFPTSNTADNMVQSKQDKGGSQYDSNSTEQLSQDDTGSRGTGNEFRGTVEGGKSSAGNGQRSETTREQGGPDSNNSVSGSRSSAGGKTSVRTGSQEASATDSDASGSTGLSDSVVDSLQGKPDVEGQTTGDVVESAKDGRVNAADTVTAKVDKVIKENSLNSKRASRLRKTAKTMPFLSTIQLSNSDFVADRFTDNGKQGVMITDGTGTGKTFSGLSVAKALIEKGKDNILIVTPSDSINNQWVSAAGDFFGINLNKLEDTKDAGKGAVITTYANLGANEALIKRNWDLVICDESHNLMNNEKGEKTAALTKMRQLTLHPTELNHRAEQLILPKEKLEARQIVLQGARLKHQRNELTTEEQAIVDKADQLQNEEADKLTKEEVAAINAQVKDWEALNETEKPKVMFMSATPFAYVPDIDYAEGYLFDYPKVEGGTYNQPGSGYAQFMMDHFGYRMRYNKLTKPDSKVDSSLMEVEFHEWLRKTGALTGHELEIDKDYNRGFLLVDQGVGRKIDEGFDFLQKNYQKYGQLSDVLRRQFDSRRRNYLLESIKARESLPIIKEYLKTGKKVVVFYETNVARESFNPFNFTPENQAVLDASKEYAQQLKREWEMFAKERPDLVNLNLNDLKEPISIYQEAFGEDAMFFNGRVSKKKRAEYVKEFNNDDSGKNLIFVQQDAGNAGISLHDTTGKHQRVLINIGIPRRPSYAIQIEGRIYRLGNKSNAIIRYLTTATNIENGLFAETVAGRASTAENLALGRKARGLRDSFKNAYQEVLNGSWEDRMPGAEGEDVGGKENDRAIVSNSSDYDRAKAFYYARGKKTSKNKAAEGVDYFATPEPIGYKMVEWAGLKDGDRVLEPSAGHGAISRFFSPNTDNTIIEPSSRLAPQAQMNTDNAKLINGYFEDLHIGNKYDAVTMNPPFGTGGKTAVEHVAKAFKHLRNGGRVIAIIPRGAMADKRFDAWYESDDAKDAHMVGEVLLPGVTFERAGTKVATRIVIIDKGGESQGVKRIDLSRINNINELFDNLESVDMPAHQTKQTDAGTANFANSLRKGDTEGNSEVVTADSYKHTKTGEIIPSAKLNANLSDEEYRKVKSIAGKNGGYYSRYAKAFLFQDNETGRDKFVEEVNGANNTQYSVSSEAPQRAKEEVEAEIRAAFPNGKVEYVNGVPTITMPNGSKFQYSIRENIVVNAKEQRKADAAHGTSGARVQGFWKKFTGNGVQRMLAVSKNSERGTAFHEAMHAAIDLVLTEKEKNALYNYYEKKAKEQNRDVDEVIADAYRDWVLARQRKSGTMFGKLWRKVKDFCTRVKAIFDKGAEVERIMQDIEIGRVYERGTNNHSVTKRISFSKEEIQGQKGSGTTQVATTRTMYVKALKWLRNQSPEAKTVLDYGAGLGLGTDDMRSNNPDLNIDSYEPNPERWAGKEPPTYTNNTQIGKDYDLILNTNVLNVVEKPIRDLIVKDIADHLNVGGKALITTRGWSNDVNAAKNFKPADEHHAIWINKGKNGYVFQKGFDGDELKNYIQELLGDEFVVEKTRPTFGKSSVTITRVKAQPNTSAKQLELFDAESYQEMPDTYKTLKGSVVKRSKYGVGKQMGSQVYLHKDYVGDVIPKKVWENALKVLDDTDSGFEYNCVMYDTKTGNVRFDEAPDFDESREPIVGDTITVKPDGTVKRGHSNYIWHHKWLWVKNDYQGFDVNQSKAWSNKWLGTLTETADGNGIERWNTQLDRFNLEHDGEEVHYSVASPRHKIANAFTNTERKGVVDSVKDFFTEHRKSLYQDWFDKNNPLKGFDALTKATGGLSVYDQVQSLPATTAGMLKALTEGTAQHVKMANQHLKNVKMKYNVTLAMALEKIDKKQMDKAYPKYLAENGFDNWVNALGAYLGAERCLEMAQLARAEGKTYKFPKGLTEQECQDFVNKAPQQFKAAADIFYKVNDNVISIMEDAEVFSHDLAKTLRTKYRKYCPLLRDFSDTAAADSFIGGLTEGGRGIGNVSVPLERINIEGSERGVLNPLETILKSYAVMLNRAERNKVALMAVENSRSADLHELIQEVPGTTADPKNCVFTVLINGKKKAYKTTQDLYGPIVGYNLPAANLAFGVARTAARMLRTGATMSPSFILRNVLRDTVFAGISSKNGFIPIVDTIRGAIALAKDPAMRAEFEAAGVTEYNFYSSQKSRIKSLDAMAGETPASAWEIMKAVFSRLEATSDFFESSTRMGEYMKARQKGLSMEEAARAAREVTLDFSRSGRVGEQVNQVVPFFNACLQGGDKMVRLFREDFVGTSQKVFWYIMLPSLLLLAMNWNEDWYKDLDPDIKNNYWCLGRNIRIPKPQEAGVLFGSGIEALFQQAADKDKDAVSNFLKAFSSNMMPSVLPTLILPLIEWSANYSFFKGRPLVGNKYSRLPDELQYNDYTSELSKGIGSALKVSPMKIDNLVRGYTGTMGALLWSMAGEPFAKANNLPAKHFSELPFVRDFNVTDANLSRPMNEFYGILDKANRQHAGYGVKGKPEAAVKGIRSAGAMISKIRKDIDKITHSNLTPERKRELIDKRKEKMNQIAKQATARYGKYFE